jgi:hypothetical protein
MCNDIAIDTAHYFVHKLLISQHKLSYSNIFLLHGYNNIRFVLTIAIFYIHRTTLPRKHHQLRSYSTTSQKKKTEHRILQWQAFRLFTAKYIISKSYNLCQQIKIRRSLTMILFFKTYITITANKCLLLLKCYMPKLHIWVLILSDCQC